MTHHTKSPLGSTLIFLVLLFILASSCATPQPTSQPIPTETATLTPPPPTETPTPQPTPTDIPLTHESFTCIDPSKVEELCLGLKPINQKQLADMFIDSLSGPANAQYWQETLDLPKGKVASIEQVREWLASHEWKVPFASPTGTEFLLLHGEHLAHKGRFESNSQMGSVGYLDFSLGIQFIVFSPPSYKENQGGVQNRYLELLKLNAENWPLANSTGVQGSGTELYGTFVDEQGRVVFVMGSQSQDYAPIKENHYDRYLFGTNFSNDADVATSMYEAYVRAMATLTNKLLNGEKDDGSTNPLLFDVASADSTDFPKRPGRLPPLFE